MRLSFKKMPRATGLAGVAEPNPPTEIKGDGKTIGQIIPPHYSDKDYVWRVYLYIKREPTPQDPCEWRSACLKKTFQTEPEARQFLKDNWAELSKKDIHKFD